ncbi:hypothetical protein [Mycoplasma phocoeninasale]|uniref:Uncharacterized protein n=1 Tax=Mycoplasma phocoeninasale TaxID=2726117 RepID=A0A858U2Q9_9MOLU|nr:hypothetical protein [Mycoplasma phocoeninasale]MBN0970648.1 hypothetical protein [Mycoplasma phocoeninasale]QJG66241.1 hypothetical protein HGG64_00730 [Mycoplasma phocoeninasale]
MNNRKNELKKLKTIEIHSIWYRALWIATITITWILLIYISAVFQNKYESTLRIVNDVIVSCLVGFLSAILLILASFIFLDIYKRLKISDFFEYYAYLNSLRSHQKQFILKERRIKEVFDLKSAMTKSQFTALVASLLEYSEASIDYANLVNEINADFAKHSYLDPDFSSQRKTAIIRTTIFNIVIPTLINSLIIFAILIFSSEETEDLRAVVRLFIVLMVTIYGVNISVFVYELYILKHVKNYESFNNFYMLSFNNYKFKFLNSSLVKK